VRRYSERPLPPYRYRPGRSPHPTRHREGHAYGARESAEPELARFGAAEWRDCAEYLYGIDLFNHGYWWEAHEALEGPWRAAGRRSETGAFLQGLIQLAAALLKHAAGSRPTAQRMAARACAKLRRAPGGLLGIDADALARDAEAFLAGARSEPPTIRLVC